jgi:hypothetical protein
MMTCVHFCVRLDRNSLIIEMNKTLQGKLNTDIMHDTFLSVSVKVLDN